MAYREQQDNEEPSMSDIKLLLEAQQKYLRGQQLEASKQQDSLYAAQQSQLRGALTQQPTNYYAPIGDCSPWATAVGISTETIEYQLKEVKAAIAVIQGQADKEQKNKRRKAFYIAFHAACAVHLVAIECGLPSYLSQFESILLFGFSCLPMYAGDISAAMKPQIGRKK